MSAFDSHTHRSTGTVARYSARGPETAVGPYGSANSFSRKSHSNSRWASPDSPVHSEECGGIRSSNQMEATAVFVKGFPKYTGSAALRALFQLYGNVTRVYIPAPLEMYDNPQKAYGVVYYDNAASARLAVANHSGHRPAYILEQELDRLPQESQPYAEFWQHESVILHVELYDIRKKGKKHSSFVNRGARQAHRDSSPYAVAQREAKRNQTIDPMPYNPMHTAVSHVTNAMPERVQSAFQDERKSIGNKCFASIANSLENSEMSSRYRPRFVASSEAVRATQTSSGLLSPPLGLQVDVDDVEDVSGGWDSEDVILELHDRSLPPFDPSQMMLPGEVPSVTVEELRQENTRLKAELAALHTEDKLYISDEETHFSRDTLLQILNAQRREMHYQQWQRGADATGKVNGAQ